MVVAVHALFSESLVNSEKRVCWSESHSSFGKTNKDWTAYSAREITFSEPSAFGAGSSALRVFAIAAEVCRLARQVSKLLCCRAKPGVPGAELR